MTHWKVGPSGEDNVLIIMETQDSTEAAEAIRGMRGTIMTDTGQEVEILSAAEADSCPGYGCAHGWEATR